MKKKYRRAARCLLILLVPALLSGLGYATLQADEPPAGGAPGAGPPPAKQPEGAAAMFQGTVKQVIDGGRYVYLQVDTGEKRVWVAAPSFDGKTGDEVLIPHGVPIADFKSKKLKRTFKSIYFVGSVRKASAGSP